MSVYLSSLSWVSSLPLLLLPNPLTQTSQEEVSRQVVGSRLVHDTPPAQSTTPVGSEYFEHRPIYSFKTRVHTCPGVSDPGGQTHIPRV